MTYLNITKDLEIKYGQSSTETLEIKKGYYNIDDFKNIFEKIGCKFVYDGNSGRIKVTGSENYEVAIPEELIYPLGLDNGVKTGSKRLGKNAMITNKVLPKLTPLSLYVYLDELDRDYNLLNGSPSNLLCIVPLKGSLQHGDIISFDLPDNFKKLAGTNINKFNFSIKDHEGNNIESDVNLELELCL